MSVKSFSRETEGHLCGSVRFLRHEGCLRADLFAIGIQGRFSCLLIHQHTFQPILMIGHQMLIFYGICYGNLLCRHRQIDPRLLIKGCRSKLRELNSLRLIIQVCVNGNTFLLYQ